MFIVKTPSIGNSFAMDSLRFNFELFLKLLLVKKVSTSLASNGIKGVGISVLPSSASVDDEGDGGEKESNLAPLNFQLNCVFSFLRVSSIYVRFFRFSNLFKRKGPKKY